jgi:hypothetical protein
LNIFIFYLDSCIVNKGEKFVPDFGTWDHLEGVQSGSGMFQKSLCAGQFLGAV